ncbi:MAG TPA: GNAT family N-acetyltransferase [Mesorhizobium sp.]|jgi:CelD/BcsL family acetyltransferase involved in cellulose biosynthesis|nr:GNAT family N-acetyltransferase [Mesorhizobium sp.]
MVEATGQAADWAHLRAASARLLDARIEPFAPESLARYRRFALSRPCGTAQQPAWVEGWVRHAVDEGFFVSVASGETTWLMLPLEVVRSGPCRVARFVGGKHANANFPAMAPNAASARTQDLAAGIIRAVRQSRPDIDALLFERMAAEQEGKRNPLVAEGAPESANLAFSVSLEGGFEAALERGSDKRRPKRHRQRSNRFKAAGGFRRIEARDPADVKRLLDFFFACKEKWFRAAGISNVFAEAGTQAALTDVFTRALDEERPSFTLQGLEVGGTLRAVSAASVIGKRITVEFASFAHDELAKLSPGQFLFHLNIEEACRLGFEFYDFGVGDEAYKRDWCDTATAHHDMVLPVSLKGRAYVGVLGAAARGKRALKRHPALWNAFKRLRRRLAGDSKEHADREAEA